MSYVIYDTNSTVILRDPRTRKEYYKTERAAKAARTRILRRLEDAGDDRFNNDYAIAEVQDFLENIEKQVERVNLMTRKKYMERINEPRCTSPASELYWSM